MWDPGREELWLLISDEGAGRKHVQVYAWCMRVEATFQDSKSHGFSIEASWIVDRTHLDRLLLTLFLAMWGVSHADRPYWDKLLACSQYLLLYPNMPIIQELDFRNPYPKSSLLIV